MNKIWRCICRCTHNPITIYLVTVFITVIIIYFLYSLFFRADYNAVEIEVIEASTYYSDEAWIYVKQEQLYQMVETLNELNKHYISLDELNGFYAVLFAAVAVIAALLAVFGWRYITNLKDKLKKFEDVEKRVEFLYKRKDYADEIRREFDNEKIESSFALDDKNNDLFLKIKEYMINEHEDFTWLELFVAHHLVTQDEKYEDAERIYNFIELRNLFGNDSRVKALLYHFKAQLYQSKFNSLVRKQNLFQNGHDHINGCFVNYDSNHKEIADLKRHIQDSIRYYEKVIDIDNDNSQAHGNLAVTKISMFKLEMLFGNKETEWLLKANEHLKQVEKIKNRNKESYGYNYWWDKARVLFYLNHVDASNQTLLEEIEYLMEPSNCIERVAQSIKNIVNYETKPWNSIFQEHMRLILMDKVCNEINNIKDARAFLKKIGEESKEFNNQGFPGDGKLIEECYKKLNGKFVNQLP